MTPRIRLAAAAFLAAALVLAAQTAKSPKATKPASGKAATTTKRKAPAKSKRPVTRARAKAKSKPKTPPRPRGQMRPTAERYKQIEQALAARGYLNEEPDGKWRPPAVEALRAFQADHQLPPTGKLDALSLIQLGLGPKQ
jgi:peptidoglycan hydrolase-like protein with peptidoglycan-binding domain